MTGKIYMTAKTHKNHGAYKIGASTDRHTDVSPTDIVRIFYIAVQMDKAGIPENFIIEAVRIAQELKGAADLMYLWSEEGDQTEKDEIIADIQDLIEASKQKEITEEMHVRFNDLDSIAKDIRGFKDSLYQEVMKRGGISKLAELTGIPQPSLSRFFNSNAMPRRSTVLAIAKALNLDKLPIDMKWSK